MDGEAIRLLVVDNDPKQITFLKMLFSEIGDVLVVATGMNGLDMIRKIESDPSIDAIYSEIEMPELNGNDAYEHLRKQGYDPPIVFVTSHPEYAVAAFGLKVVDFLVKPVSFVRLKESVDYLKFILNAKRDMTSRGFPLQAVQNDKPIVIYSDDVIFIETMDRATVIHTVDQEFPYPVSISTLEKWLYDYGFRLTHRSYLINMKKIKDVEQFTFRRRDILFEGTSKVASVSSDHYKMVEKFLLWRNL